MSRNRSEEAPRRRGGFWRLWTLIHGMWWGAVALAASVVVVLLMTSEPIKERRAAVGGGAGDTASTGAAGGDGGRSASRPEGTGGTVTGGAGGPATGADSGAGSDTASGGTGSGDGTAGTATGDSGGASETASGTTKDGAAGTTTGSTADATAGTATPPATVAKAPKPPFERAARKFEAPADVRLLSIVLYGPGVMSLNQAALAPLSFPITVALPPKGETTAALARMIAGRGHEVLIDMPLMVPGTDEADADKRLRSSNGAPAVKKAVAEIMKLHDAALGATGPNGARAFSTWEPLLHVLDALERSGHAWIEPAQGADSTGARYSIGNKLPFAQADLHMEPADDASQMLVEVTNVARRGGKGNGAIVWLPADAVTLRALTELKAVIEPLGVRLAPVSAVVQRRQKD